MKKLLFLFANLLIMNHVVEAYSCLCCIPSNSSSSSCDDDACHVAFSGRSFRSMENMFQNGAPSFVSLFNTDVVRNIAQHDKHGGLEITVFGGKNIKYEDSAAYYFPYGFKEFTFDGSIVNPETFATNLAWRSLLFSFEPKSRGTNFIAVYDDYFDLTDMSTGVNYFRCDATTYQFDTNTDKSKILPWNFGITYAALFEPLAASAKGSLAGTGLITSPTFKSTIAPQHFYTHVGAGIAFRYHFSDDKQGWFAQISTSVEKVTSKICLRENVLQEKTLLNNENFPAQTTCIVHSDGQLKSDNPYGLPLTSTSEVSVFPPALDNEFWPACSLLIRNSDFPVEDTFYTAYTAVETPKGSINEAYLNGSAGTYFPTDDTTITNTSVAPANVTQAFNQDAWQYGKIGAGRSILGVADIEFLVGYQWMCGECASNNWYVGMIVPTGNKPCATYVAPAIVGNGYHFGLMGGSSLELMLAQNQHTSCWYRLDVNARYLFGNKQKRSLDLKGNTWSRYMMVWDSKDSYISALDAVAGTLDSQGAVDTAGVATRYYTPGINIFTTDVKVVPGLQTRLNQALYIKTDGLQAELGWNMLVKSAECVTLAGKWDKAPAFADPSFMGGVGLNNGRTIYNDSQTTCANAVPALYMKAIGSSTNTLVYNLARSAVNKVENQNVYDQHVIKQEQFDMRSGATPESYVHTPYATLGYLWESPYRPALSFGGSYTFSVNNSTMQQWNVWGKFETAF